MTRHFVIFIAVFISFSNSASKRFALIAGVNNGGPKRDILKYAVKDARSFSTVMQEMGGVPEENQTILEEPKAEAFAEAIARLKSRVDSEKGNSRTEVIVYYSGHADEKGLLFGTQRFDYLKLRRALDGIPADVRITILDACASGTITRLKGGTHSQAFLVDASSDMTGYAFITSSSDNEVAQESDEIGGSFFTHYLVSGLRGAADASQDKKITLSESYQFAFHETLARTQSTMGGTQHPSYDMKLSGKGDVVMTDLRKTGAALLFGPDVTGRVYIRDSGGNLVAELAKPAGRPMELGLAPGQYKIQIHDDYRWRGAKVTIEPKERKHVGKKRFKPSLLERTVFRGGAVSFWKPHFSAGLATSITRELRGPQLALVGNQSYKLMKGLQFGLLGYNIAHDKFEGIQLAPLFNQTHSPASGGQISCVMNRAERFRGVQFGMISNIVQTKIQGAQISAVNVSYLNEGAQIAGIVNISQRRMEGVQFAGFMNQAGGIAGPQFACVLNRSENHYGAQVGLVNYSKKLRGVQLGLLNLSDSIRGIPIGIFNYSGNGVFSGSFDYDELDLHSITLRSGAKHFYTLFNVGRDINGSNRITALGYGIGFNLPYYNRFFSLELMERYITDVLNADGDDDDWVSTIRFQGGITWFKHFSMYAGLTLNLLKNFDADHLAPPMTTLGRMRHIETGLYAWPGFTIGIQFGRLAP